MCVFLRLLMRARNVRHCTEQSEHVLSQESHQTPAGRTQLFLFDAIDTGHMLICLGTELRKKCRKFHDSIAIIYDRPGGGHFAQINPAVYGVTRGTGQEFIVEFMLMGKSAGWKQIAAIWYPK